MAFFRTLRSHQFCTFLGHQNTPAEIRNHLCGSSIASSFPDFPKCGSSSKSCSDVISLIFQRTFSVSPQTVEQSKTDPTDSDKDEWVNDYEKDPRKTKCMKRYEKIIREKKQKKPLDVMFKEAVGLVEKNKESSESSDEELGSVIIDDSKVKETKELKKKLRKLENEVKSLKAKKAKNDEISEVQAAPKGLYALFTGKPEGMKPKTVKKNDEISEVQAAPKSLSAVCTGKPEGMKPKTVNHYKNSESLKPERLKKLPPEMVSLVRLLHGEGYLSNANFLPQNKLDISCFSDQYPRDFLRSAAERFGKDHQEIFEKLSFSDVKNVAVFGCPSTERQNVYAAKRLRAYFKIKEETVCETCKLKESCKFVNLSFLEYDTSSSNLADLLRILTKYALDSELLQVVLPREVNASISKLLKEVSSISLTGPKDAPAYKSHRSNKLSLSSLFKKRRRVYCI